MIDSRRDLKWLWLMFAAFVFIGALAITNQSLWIDEAHSAHKAAQRNIQDLRTSLLEDNGSDINMPFYMFFIWLWDKGVGIHPEWLLRASNLIWYAILQFALLTALRSRPGTGFWCALTFSLCPFVWFYLDEARPYIMQLAGTVLVASFFLRRFTAKANGEFGWSALAAGLLLLCGSSLLGVLWAGAAILLLGWFVWREEVTLHRGDWTGLAFCLAPLAGLGAYYVDTLFFQPRELASYGKTGLGNVIFALYELFGLSGLGPGRDSIRAMGLSAFEPYGVLLVLAAFTLCGLVLAGLFRLRREHRHLFWPLTVAWIAPITGTFALGTLGHVSVLGRHLTPALPALLLLMGWTLARLWANSRVRALTCVTLVPFLFSSGMLRLAERHTKTDARAGLAAAEPIIAANDTLWWVGDRELPWYYSSSIGRVPNAILVIHPSANDIAALPAPAAIFLLRPDVFDQRGAAQDYIRARNYRREREWNTLSLWRATQPAPN